MLQTQTSLLTPLHSPWRDQVKVNVNGRLKGPAEAIEDNSSVCVCLSNNKYPFPRVCVSNTVEEAGKRMPPSFLCRSPHELPLGSTGLRSGLDDLVTDQQGEPPVVLGQQCVPCGHLLYLATRLPWVGEL